MEPSFFPQVFSADPHELAMTGLRLVHFVGLAVGLGSATLLDFIILRFLIQRRISREGRDIVYFGSRFINVGLAMLWLSGAGFLASYAITDPALLMNPKIWAKLAIVAVLTANGIVIHRLVLPVIGAQVTRPLFHGLTRRQRTVMLASGAISVISWYVPVLLGAAPQLNFVVPAVVILAAYAAAIVATALLLHAAIAGLGARRHSADGADAPPAIDGRPDVRPALPQALAQTDGGRLVVQSIDAALAEALGEAEAILRERISVITIARLHAELKARKPDIRRAA